MHPCSLTTVTFEEMGLFSRLFFRFRQKGKQALYFEASDLPMVWAYIKERYGVGKVTQYHMGSLVSLGGEDFVYTDDGDDHRLSAMTRSGDVILDEIQLKFPKATMTRR